MIYSEEQRKIIRAKDKAFYKANKERIAERKRKYYLLNKEMILQKRKLEYAAKTDIKKARRKKYVSENRGAILALCAKRRASKQQRTPKWANLKLIKEFYENCPKGYHVDHIIPLNGKNICGLHVHTNLQYLTASENSKKGNRFNG